MALASKSALMARHLGRASWAPSSRATCVRTMASATGQRLNLSKAVDKAHEGKSFMQIAKLPPGALQGLKEGKADDMLAAFNIMTISDLGRWKYYRIAKAIATLAATEAEGARPSGAESNINKAVDQAYEAHSFGELLAAPPSALQGLAPWTDGALAELRIKSVKDLANWKYAQWAEAITAASEFETDDFASR